MKTGGFLFRVLLPVAAVCLYGGLLQLSGLCAFPENKTYDSRMRTTAAAHKPSERIFTVLLDQESIQWAQQEFGWAWPWPRKAYGDMVRFFDRADAAAVTFDVLFSEPSTYGTLDDEYFAKACAEYGNVVQPVYFASKPGYTPQWPAEYKKPALAVTGYPETLFAELKTGFSALFQIPSLCRTAGSFGQIRSMSDPDGVIRRERLFFPAGDALVPALGLAGLLCGAETALSFDIQNGTAAFAGKQIPVDKNGAVFLRYRKNIDEYIPYTAKDILQSYYAVTNGREPLLEPALFENAYIFFGFYAPGLFDICSTPIDTVYPGVGVHITTLDNFLQNDFIKPAPDAVTFFMLILCAFAGALPVYTASISKSGTKAAVIQPLVCLVLGIVLVTASAYLLFALGIWIQLVSPLAALVCAYLAALLVSYGTESRQRRYLKSAFRHYLSPAVIEDLIAHPDRLKLGGERREISIFFSDIQGFTSIAEKLDPEILTSFLNTYLSEMSDIILAAGGTIDKYEGDAIIAFWNAPAPMEDHARRALEAAVRCQEKLAEINPALQKSTGMPVLMRIGLNTGPAVIGNMGSKHRFDYTMLGDSVNLAARLEGLNKQFGTYTMCTAAMKAAAEAHGTAVSFRELARVAVVGKKEAVTVFEPLLENVRAEKQKILPVFDAGRALYYAGDFARAAALFSSIADTDSPAAVYAEKCRMLADNPPEHWTGIWLAETK